MKKSRVIGLGGIFFKARNPSKLGAWYQKHLGLPIEAWGGFAFPWRDAIDPKKNGSTVWNPFDADTKYFGPGKQGSPEGVRLYLLPYFRWISQEWKGKGYSMTPSGWCPSGWPSMTPAMGFESAEAGDRLILQ